ncbi:MAG: SIS domain-containing protein, partial [Candidatus Macondimonas sp.]
MAPWIHTSLDQHQAALDAVREMAPDIVRSSDRLTETLRRGGRVFACGNGGSAADAQHFAAELTGR